MQKPIVNGMNDFCADGCRPAKGLYHNNVLDRVISHTEIFQDRPPCGLNPELPFGCLLNQEPIRIHENSHPVLGPDTHGFVIYRELDVNYVRRWAKHFILPVRYGWEEKSVIRRENQ